MNESMANSEVVQATEKVDDIIFDASIDAEQFSDYKVTNILKQERLQSSLLKLLLQLII